MIKVKLFDKIKNILFDEEEVEVPTREVKEVRSYEPPKVEVKEEVVKEEVKPAFKEEIPTRPAFNFPEFIDEKPKERVVEKEEELKRTRNLNILDYERSHRKDKNPILKKLEKEEEPKKKQFKPTPVISPVYGIVDNFQTKEEAKKETKISFRTTASLDIDEVRRKAFGTLEDEIVSTLDKPIGEFYDQEEAKEEPTKTIDELLIDDLDEQEKEEYEDIVTIPKAETLEEKLDLLDEIDASLDEVKKEEVRQIPVDDTIESDLFKLIDSMYDNGKDGEE